MLDLETMGTDPGSAIVQIGAVRFDADGVKNTIEVNVSLQSCADAGLRISPETCLWWLRQDRELCRQWQQNAVALEDALMLFSWWLGSDKAIVWGNAATFDNAILRAAYNAAGIECPWHYWNDRCFRTVKNIFNLPPVSSERKHSTLSDAIAQARQIVQSDYCGWILGLKQTS